MTIKTTLSFTDRHHRFLRQKVGQGVFASASAVVASAIEQMIRDEASREAALSAMTDEIRRRMTTAEDDFLDAQPVLEKARAALREA